MEWIHFDERRTIVNPGDKEKTIHFCVEHFLTAANESIGLHGHFYAALSGGSTPKIHLSRTSVLKKFPKNRLDEKCPFFGATNAVCRQVTMKDNYKMAMENGMAAPRNPARANLPDEGRA